LPEGKTFPRKNVAPQDSPSHRIEVLKIQLQFFQLWRLWQELASPQVTPSKRHPTKKHGFSREKHKSAGFQNFRGQHPHVQEISAKLQMTLAVSPGWAEGKFSNNNFCRFGQNGHTEDIGPGAPDH